MAVIGLRLIEMYGLLFLLRGFARIQRYWWSRQAIKEAEDADARFLSQGEE